MISKVSCAFLSLLAAVWVYPAHSANQLSICVEGANGCTPVSTVYPLPTTGSGGGGGGNSTIVGPLGTSTPPSGAVSVTVIGLPGVYTPLGTLPGQGTLEGGVRPDGKPDNRPFDYCAYPKSFVDNVTATGTGVQIVAGQAGKRIYVCSVTIVTSAAANVSLIEGGNSTCTSGTIASVYGNGSTVNAANGMQFAGNGGIRDGGSGVTIGQTGTNGNYLCVLFTTTNSPTVNTRVGYVIQ
jgi:hypothetical protein